MLQCQKVCVLIFASLYSAFYFTYVYVCYAFSQLLAYYIQAEVWAHEWTSAVLPNGKKAHKPKKNSLKKSWSLQLLK